MAQITQLSRVVVPVTDQDAAIDYYTTKLGFELVADIPFGDGDRWVEVRPPAGGAAVALVPPRDNFRTGRVTGIALESGDVRADYEELKAAGVNVDDELTGGDGEVPLLFSFSDPDGNRLMVVEAQQRG